MEVIKALEDILERGSIEGCATTDSDIVQAIDEILRLRAENEALRKLAKEAADEIEGYVDAVYPANDRSLYPDHQRRYKRDMDIVLKINAALHQTMRS